MANPRDNRFGGRIVIEEVNWINFLNKRNNKRIRCLNFSQTSELEQRRFEDHVMLSVQDDVR